MTRRLIPLLILLANPVFAQGGLEVKVLSAKIVPNPRPDLSHDYKGKNVLQLEVLGIDRSGATSIAPRDKDIALYDCNGQQAARLLCPVDVSTRNFPNEARKEIRASLIFSVPEGGKQQYFLRWAVTRYAQQVTSLTWTGNELKLPLEQERDGITVCLDKIELGHESAAHLAEWQLEPVKAARMAADHLILSLRCSGLRHEAAGTPGVSTVEISTAADGQPQDQVDHRLDFSTTTFSGHGEGDSAGKLSLLTTHSLCHFSEAMAIPKITRIRVEVVRDVPFEEGWATLDLGGQ